MLPFIWLVVELRWVELVRCAELLRWEEFVRFVELVEGGAREEEFVVWFGVAEVVPPSSLSELAWWWSG